MPNNNSYFDWDKAVNVLTNTGQLLDGWHNDGTAWSEWDESVRQDVSELLGECIARSSNPIITKERHNGILKDIYRKDQ